MDNLPSLVREAAQSEPTGLWERNREPHHGTMGLGVNLSTSGPKHENFPELQRKSREECGGFSD
jgi:hypothetical protein